MMKDYLVLGVRAFINISSFLLYIPCESYKGVIPFALKTKTKYRTMAKCKIAHVSTFPIIQNILLLFLCYLKHLLIVIRPPL